VTLLREHREQQDQEHQAWGEGWQQLGLVFTREDGSMLRPDSITAAFSKLVKRAGVPRIRLHDLRHTHASLAAGVDMKVVSSRLGHSTISITADLYTHVVPDLARRAADDIAASVAYQRAARDVGVTPLLPHEVDGGGGRDPPEDETAGQ
jgi:integrase